MKHLKQFETYVSDEQMKTKNYIDTIEDINNSSAWEEMPEGEKEKLEDAYQDELDNVFDKKNESNDVYNALEHYQNTSSFAHNKFVDIKSILESESIDAVQRLKFIKEITKSYFNDLPSEPNLLSKIMSE